MPERSVVVLGVRRQRWRRRRDKASGAQAEETSSRSREPGADPDPRRAGHGQGPRGSLSSCLQRTPPQAAGRRQLRGDHRRAAASRFFGHKRGSFTGALTDEPGFFRAADGGVLFLDEVAELSLRAQAHLLRILENHTVVPVGQTRETRGNVAVILATNQDLEEAVRERRLRADFHDRFRNLKIPLVPLRERPWDIPLLLDHFRRYHERKQRKPTLGFRREELRMLIGYDWPGNVRELARACSNFAIRARPGAWIDPALIDACLPNLRRASPNPNAGPLLAESLSMHDAVRDFQRELIQSRLELYGGSVKAARESLGLPKVTFHRYMKRLGISAGSGGMEE